MNWYRVRLNGQNFLLNFDRKPQKYGFYTTRDVEAKSFEDAELKAVELIKNDDVLIIDILNDKADSPMIFVKEMRLLESDEKRLINLGFTFYSE